MASQDYAQRFGQLVLRTNFRAMSTNYTCHRCFSLLRSNSRVQTSAHGPISICQRGISANDTPFRKAFPERNTKAFASHPRRSFAKQAYTFLESYGQVPKNEPTQLPSPAGLASTNPPDVTGRVLLQPNNLFHPFSRSPSQAIRRRAAFIKQHAYCPHPNHQPTRLPFAPDDPEARKSSVKLNSAPPSLVDFECPDCGIPVYCSEDHWADDYESHLEICDTLRQINEDDHDLRSGRFFPEFEYPDMQMEEALVNMTNWDTLLYTREFTAIDADRSMRQATRLLTYPVTIGSVLHELSPYNIRSGGRLTTEGLKSLSALRYTLHPPRTGAGMDIKGIRPKPPPVRIFILGARAESSLPREVWVQLPFMFPPRAAFHLIFIGPESMVNRDHEFPLPERTPTNPFGAVVEGRINHQLKISTFVEYYHTLHKAGHFAPYDPYFDCFVLFHPGLGHPASSHEWEETLPQLLETKVPILITGYTQWDMQRDLKWVEEKMAGEVDVLMEPGENRFRSLRWDLNDLDPQDISCGNWGIWAFRGKRYETTHKDSYTE